jgi:hypothetical protein
VAEEPRETRVLNAVVTLVDSLLDDFDVIEMLTDLTERCTHLLDVAAAGLLLAGPRGRLHLMAATSEQSRELELFQLQSEEGPCLDCYATGDPVTVADLTAEHQRWPRFVPAAAEAGFASVHAIPMRAAGIKLGALGLFGSNPGHLAGADLLVAQTLAHIASVAILQRQSFAPDIVMPRLRSALADRMVVEQAKGYLRESLDVSIPEAFVLLRSYARSHGDHLTQVCRRLIGDPAGSQPLLDALREIATPA